MRTEAASRAKSAAITKDQVIDHLKHALADRQSAITATLQFIDRLPRAAHLQVMLLTNAGPESRLVADMVTRLITGSGLPKAAVCSAMNRAPESWPRLSRTSGTRSVALLEDAESVGTALAIAWLRKLARQDDETATVFLELAGPRHLHDDLLDAANVLAAEHKPLIDVHVIDLSIDAKHARD